MQNKNHTFNFTLIKPVREKKSSFENEKSPKPNSCRNEAQSTRVMTDGEGWSYGRTRLTALWWNSVGNFNGRTDKLMIIPHETLMKHHCVSHLNGERRFLGLLSLAFSVCSTGCKVCAKPFPFRGPFYYFFSVLIPGMHFISLASNLLQDVELFLTGLYHILWTASMSECTRSK